MLEIFVWNHLVLLRYTPLNGINWITKKFQDNEELVIKKIFTLQKEDLIEVPDFKSARSKTFKIGEQKNNYYVINKRVLNTKDDVLIHSSIEVSKKLFIYETVSVFLKLEDVAEQQIIIGGDTSNSIPLEGVKNLIKSFPTKREFQYYIDSRIEGVMSNYLEGIKDSKDSFEKYVNKRRKIIAERSPISSIMGYEKEKYEYILTVLKDMLKNSSKYTELDWQNKILDIILILYPKYIKTIKECPVHDFYFTPGKTTKRSIDIMLVDSNGNTDLIEIKKPFPNCIVTKNPTYRDNHTPLRDLSGTVMQVEKYIFHLSKWGVDGEKYLNKKYSSLLPPNIDIKITNPKGIIILGRSNDFTKEQLFDFEIIKRKYANIIDILTYDDLIQRLENILLKFAK